MWRQRPSLQVVSIDVAGIDAAMGSSDLGDSRGPASPDPPGLPLTADRPRSLSRGLSRDSLPALTGIPESGSSMPPLEEDASHGGVRRVSSLSQALVHWKGSGGELGASGGREQETVSDQTSEGLAADLDATLRTCGDMAVDWVIFIRGTRQHIYNTLTRTRKRTLQMIAAIVLVHNNNSHKHCIQKPLCPRYVVNGAHAERQSCNGQRGPHGQRQL